MTDRQTQHCSISATSVLSTVG